MSFLYFAYGSNMLSKRMFMNCPTARYKFNAELKKYQLFFCGNANVWKGATATIAENEKNSVWGVVWEISKEHEEALNKQEVNYQSMQVPVHNEDTTVMCKVYFRQLEETDVNCLPSNVYKTVMVKGAKEHKLPLSYIQKLESLPDNGYNGKVEVLKNIEI